MDIAQFEGRKREHIQLALDPSNQASQVGGLDHYRLIHEALPDFNFDEVRLDARCLGWPSRTPFYVAGMTAGHADAFKLNRALAIACERRGWAMGVGSQRRQLESRESGSSESNLDQWKKLREEVPELTLFANLGIAQVIDAPVAEILRVVQTLNAQALAIHLNALQEVMQPEGTPQFRGAFAAIERVVDELGNAGIRVLLKETGCGFSRTTLEKIAQLPLAAVDVSGLGGTHWGRIEGARAKPGSLHAKAAQTFADWGVSTPESVRDAREVFSSQASKKKDSSAHDQAGLALPRLIEVWASGGVRSGLDAAKLIALGADRVGYAKPALEAALAGDEALDQWMELQEFELKTALFCTGCRTPESLRKEGKWKANIV
jgi:isopentenyl-diphosphate delta-isomerase